MIETYTVQLIEDENGELVLPIPDGILDAVGWEIGDTIEFVFNDLTGEVNLVLVEEEEFDEDEDLEDDEDLDE